MILTLCTTKQAEFSRNFSAYLELKKGFVDHLQSVQGSAQTLGDPGFDNHAASEIQTLKPGSLSQSFAPRGFSSVFGDTRTS